MSKLALKLCSLTISIAFATTAMAGSVWKITSLDWPPYSDSNMASQGNSIQKLRILLKKEGIELVVEYYPWARARYIAQQEGYVGYFPAWPEEVSEGFTASSPVDWSEIGVLTYMDSGLEWTNLNALFDNKIGLIKTYNYPEYITKLADDKPQNIDPTPNELSLLKKLSAKRIKSAITDPTVMHYLAEKEGISNIKTLKILKEKALVVAFKKDTETLKKLELLEKLLKQ